MPHHGFSGDDILTVKLPNGYNVGIELGDVESIEVRAKHTPAAVERKLPPPTASKPTVAVLGTGGTIASYVDYRTGAVHPAVTAEELVFSVPELLDVCNVRARVIYSVYSENMKPEQWQRLAQEAGKELNGGAAGVVIPHGTDTLHLTSAAPSTRPRSAACTRTAPSSYLTARFPAPAARRRSTTRSTPGSRSCPSIRVSDRRNWKRRCRGCTAS